MQLAKGTSPSFKALESSYCLISEQAGILGFGFMCPADVAMTQPPACSWGSPPVLL